MFKVDLITLCAIFGTLQGLVLSLIFWTKKRLLSNRLFSLLLLATSVRIAKNIIVHLHEINPELVWADGLRDFLINFGLAHQFAIGPLFMLYFYAKLKPGFYFKTKSLLHFLPYFSIVILSPFISWGFWGNGGLFLSYVSILAYYIWSLNHFVVCQKLVMKTEAQWLRGLLVSSGILLFAYSPALFNYLGYIGGAFLYAIGIILVGSIILVNKGSYNFFQKKYRTSPLLKEKARKYRVQLEEIMYTDQPFLNSELTLQSLAGSIDIPSHHLSQVINREFGKSYADYINGFRLDEAAKRLADSKYSDLKIAAIAFDSGFGSQPSFNTLFKRKYGVTPSEFRRNASRPKKK